MRIIVTVFLSILFLQHIYSQEIEKVLTLDDVLELATGQSRSAILAKHKFRAKYWQYRTFVAKYRPNLNMKGTLPNLNRSIRSDNVEQNGKLISRYYESNLLSSSTTLSLDQNIPLTGGQLFISSNLERTDLLDYDSASYRSTPISVTYSQPINGYNSFKWERKIEPLKYEEAKKEYLSAMQDVAITAVGHFFDLILAYKNLEIAEINYSNSDTLFKVAKGRYNIGTIAENELLQMEYNLLSAGSALNSARLNLEDMRFRLRSFLGFNDNVRLKLVLPKEIPSVMVDISDAMDLALANNPEVLANERQIIEGRKSVAEAKSKRGLSADLRASYGIAQTASEIDMVYKDPRVSQQISLGFEIPILDWGKGKGNVKMAESSLEVTKTNIEQAKIDFEHDVYLKVMEFNMQDDQVIIAAKADTIANKQYMVSKQRYLIGKVGTTELNTALSNKDNAKRGYVSALRSFWVSYFNLQKLTLYNLREKKLLETDFDLLVK